MKEYIVGIENEHSHALDVCYKEELIRCKDCNNCSAYGGGDAYCIAFRKWFSENFYCGWALRRVE